jgi:DUF4097 and DUF4098 domain-containing protein YvlB
MQNQEQSYQGPEPLPPDELRINIDPREQPQKQISQQEETDRSYTQGYSGLDEQDPWPHEGEKLRPKFKHTESMAWPLLLVVLLCLALITAGLFGLILNWLSWLLVAVVLIAFLALRTGNRHVTIRTLPPSTFQIMEHARLNLRNHSGNVSLHRGEEGSISVTATIHARGINYENMPVRYDQYGDTLTISSHVGWNFLLFGSRSVDFEITVPASCDIHMSNDSGKVILQGTSGDIRVHTDHGSIEAHNLQGQIILKTDHGDIEVSNLQGQTLLQTDHGSIKAHDLQGRLTLKTDHGSIETSNLQGQIHLQTDHGNISANGLQGTAKLRTDKGNISVGQSTLAGSSRLSTDAGLISFDGALDPTGDYEMRTDMGTIAVTFPPDTSFYVDAKTDAGSITTNLPLVPQQNKRLSASVGNGPSYPRLRLRTDMGSINLLRT